MTCSATSTATAKSSDLSQRISGSSSTELHYLGAGASHEFGPVRQWGPRLASRSDRAYAYLDFRPHAGGRDALLADVQVDLVPGRPRVSPDRAAVSMRKHRQSSAGSEAPVASKVAIAIGHVAVGQRSIMLLDGRHAGQGTADGVARNVVLQVSVRLRPGKCGAHALAELARGFRAASRKVGVRALRFSARGSPPSASSARLRKAFSIAFAPQWPLRWLSSAS